MTKTNRRGFLGALLGAASAVGLVQTVEAKPPVPVPRPPVAIPPSRWIAPDHAGPALRNATAVVAKELERLLPGTHTLEDLHRIGDGALTDTHCVQTTLDRGEWQDPPEYIARALAERCARQGVRYFGVLPLPYAVAEACLVRTSAVAVRGMKIYDPMLDLMLYRFDVVTG